MTWCIAAFLAACLEAVKDLVQKKHLTTCHPLVFAAGSMLASVPLLASLLIIDGIPTVSKEYFIAFFCVCLLDSVGIALYVKALQKSALSIVVPLMMFTPLFMLVTSPLMISEYPGTLGIIGVLLVIIGSYALNAESFHKGPFAPLQALISDTGAKCMLGAALIFSICCNLHKVCIVASSSYFYATSHQVFCFILLCIPALRSGAVQKLHVRQVQGIGIVGVFVASIMICQFYAISHGLVVYSTAIKRLSVLISICLAHVFLQEGGIRQRLTGAGIMTAGAVLTAL